MGREEPLDHDLIANNPLCVKPNSALRLSKAITADHDKACGI
jgi:hypothetical protein